MTAEATHLQEQPRSFDPSLLVSSITAGGGAGLIGVGAASSVTLSAIMPFVAVPAVLLLEGLCQYMYHWYKTGHKPSGQDAIKLLKYTGNHTLGFAGMAAGSALLAVAFFGECVKTAWHTTACCLGMEFMLPLMLFSGIGTWIGLMAAEYRKQPKDFTWGKAFSLLPVAFCVGAAMAVNCGNPVSQLFWNFGWVTTAFAAYHYRKEIADSVVNGLKAFSCHYLPNSDLSAYALGVHQYSYSKSGYSPVF